MLGLLSEKVVKKVNNNIVLEDNDSSSFVG